jgi:hypothetical protein
MFFTWRHRMGDSKPRSSGGRHRPSRQPGRRVILTTAPPSPASAVDRIFANGMRPTAPIPGLEDIRARLRAVERRHRAVLAALVALLVVVLAGAGLLRVGQGPSYGEGLEGQRFSLKDATGKERAWLGMDKGHPVLRFRDAHGAEQAGLEVGDRGLTLRVIDARGHLQTGLSLEKEGVALLTFDQGGQPHVGQDAVTNRIGSLVPTPGGRARR